MASSMLRAQGRKSEEPPTEDSQVGGDADIAGTADFLSPGDAHAVDAPYHRFLAHQDGVDHAVEEVHVLAVLRRFGGVVLRILLGVAAGAEGIAAGAGEDHGHYRPVHLRPVETGDNALDHLRGI
jgi:hypothetical protein